MENVKERIHNDFSNLRMDREKYFEKFYENNYNFVYRICFSILKNKENSEDVTQSIFEKIYKMPEDKMASSYEATWLYTVAKNEAIGFIRKNRLNLPLDEQMNEAEDGKNAISDIEESEDYKKLVKKLNKKQEQIVSLKVLSEFTFKEIGLMMSMPTATVQWYYYSSIKSLKVAIGNLAMFVVALSLGLKLYKRVEQTEEKKKSKANKQLSIDESSQTPSNEEDLNEATTKQDIPITNVATGNETGNYTEVMQVQDNCEANNNLLPDVFLGLAGVFLICSIVFGIIFARRNKKHKK